MPDNTVAVRRPSRPPSRLPSHPPARPAVRPPLPRRRPGERADRFRRWTARSSWLGAVLLVVAVLALTDEHARFGTRPGNLIYCLGALGAAMLIGGGAASLSRPTGGTR